MTLSLFYPSPIQHLSVFVQELIFKDIDVSELDFSRYGETFFEVRSFRSMKLSNHICLFGL